MLSKQVHVAVTGGYIYRKFYNLCTNKFFSKGIISILKSPATRTVFFVLRRNV